MDLTGAHRQRYAGKRPHRTEVFDEVAHLDQRRSIVGGSCGEIIETGRNCHPCHLPVMMRRRIRLLNKTAIKSMPPRKTRNQSFGTCMNSIPCWTTP